MTRYFLLALVSSLGLANAALKIASALSVIEWSPEKVAKEDFFNGSVTISNGGVPNLFSDTSIDLASNAETQSLRNYASHKNLRIIYTICEVSYRIVAHSSAIKTLLDLKGKKIGAISGTSSAYFVQQMMESVGLKTSDYTVVTGNQCTAEPCGSGTLPAMLKAGTVDAVGFWEPTVELAARAIGKENAVFFSNGTVYREIFSLHTTSDKLADIAKRAEIVEFVSALDKALNVFRTKPDSVYKRAASAVGITEELMKAVWPVHNWSGTLPSDLVSVMVEEDAYVAGLDRRQAMSEDVLKNLVDSSVLAEIRGS